ncbi:MAG: LysM peptidoglycan-binding domain-containing M23 family metallopeptidase [Deltaproteobacteria bacterium]|nr:LysM peptidoglycan-binding domain-containing M23 family metallopeptidase [Deltaproteobacteria bacterium]
MAKGVPPFLYPFMKTFRLAGLFFLLSFAGCVAGGGVYHTVGKGETLWRICRTYKADIQEVAELNNIKDPTEIKAGRKIFIPGVSKKKKVVSYGTPLPAEKEAEERIVIEKDRFLWPVNGALESSFGPRNGTRHTGIDISAKEGTPVKAADSGEVVFVNSSMRGYGNIIILKHKDDFYTVYAHNKENLVKKGEDVKRGEIIASVGNTGNATGNHLHFEVRQGKNVRNPLFFLP